MDVHPPKNGINRYWPKPRSQLDIQCPSVSKSRIQRLPSASCHELTILPKLSTGQSDNPRVTVAAVRLAPPPLCFAKILQMQSVRQWIQRLSKIAQRLKYRVVNIYEHVLTINGANPHKHDFINREAIYIYITIVFGSCSKLEARNSKWPSIKDHTS